MIILSRICNRMFDPFSATAEARPLKLLDELRDAMQHSLPHVCRTARFKNSFIRTSTLPRGVLATTNSCLSVCHNLAVYGLRTYH